MATLHRTGCIRLGQESIILKSIGRYIGRYISKLSFYNDKIQIRETIHGDTQIYTGDTQIYTAIMDPALVNGRRVDFHVFDMAGSIGADVMITDPTAPSYVERGWDESRLLRECERAKREKHVLHGATMIPLVMTTFGKLGRTCRV